MVVGVVLAVALFASSLLHFCALFIYAFFVCLFLHIGLPDLETFRMNFIYFQEERFGTLISHTPQALVRLYTD